MKNFKLVYFILFITLAFSCTKHVIEYASTPVDEKAAHFQLHYVVPVNIGSANNIGKVLVNDQIFATTSSPLTPYNAIPNGGVGRFYTTHTGDNNFKFYYQNTKMEDGQSVIYDSLVYDKNADLKNGKQNVFVYDFSKPPVVIDNGFPYDTNITADSDSTAWIRFYDFLYEGAGVYTNFKMQYQYQYTKDNATGELSDWINIGKPVNFSEATDWQSVRVNKTVPVSAGYAVLRLRIRIIGADGSDQGDMEVLNASNKLVPFSAVTTVYVGRHYHHILSGLRTAMPVSAVRVFTAL